jgi:hypothetical protein
MFLIVGSIPYRYATNLKSPSTLIGEQCCVSIPYRYATNLFPTFFFYCISQFQSLIGTLQTKVNNRQRSRGKSVSIPYRYATNRFLVFKNSPNLYVSIPYRYATNFFFLFLQVWDQKSFNPL